MRVSLWILILVCAGSWPGLTFAASSAGETIYDTQGKPLPVVDPVLAGSLQPPAAVKTLPKKIEIDLSEQTLSYYYGSKYKVDEFKISSGLARTPTPVGNFKILKKIPVKAYSGRRYYLPNTKWNLQFLTSGYYIHGAYWHNNFGQPMSHGCVNVAYNNVERLYEFADVGTPVVIHN